LGNGFIGVNFLPCLSRCISSATTTFLIFVERERHDRPFHRQEASALQAQAQGAFVTAASLFDGHDASINIMRRILQSTGAEVIHLGHNRSVQEIVNAALQEDVQGIAITSYQGGHVEFFKYMIDLLKAGGGENIQVFGGGGGVIVPRDRRTARLRRDPHLLAGRRRRWACRE
jgi:methylmalonyl-CoA mutase cobalamin-binding domain/chain